MKLNKIVFLFVALVIMTSSYGQQDPMFTKYMFNTLSYNPAFAGTRGFMSIGLLHRSQWVGIDGAPTSQTLNVHSPIRGEKVGLGLSVHNDNIGVSNNFGAYGVYAYHLPITKKAKLSIGIQGGMNFWSADYSSVKTDDSDIAFTDNVSRSMPNFGLGLYYYTDKFYLMFSVPHMAEHDLREAEDITTDFYGKYYRHYFAGGGVAIPIRGEDIIFKPSVLFKAVRLFKGIRTEEEFREITAPKAFDIDFSFLFYQKLWMGAAFRSALEAFDGNRSSNSSANIWANYALSNGLRLGVAYDFTLNEIQQETPGSFEIFLGYEFDYKKSKIVTPRYF